MPRRVTGQPLVRRSSGEDAALYIRKLIFDGELRPGERVPQDGVAQALGISRIPIREALITLERAGWVTIELHKGAFVNVLDEQAVRDHYELFGMSYGLAARRAVARGTAGLDTELSALVGRLTTTDDPAVFLDLVLSFHAAILRAARSPRIAVAVWALSGIVPGNIFELVPEAVEVEREGLAEIARAIQDRDASHADDAYQRMLALQADNVVALFQARNFLREPEGGCAVPPLEANTI